MATGHNHEHEYKANIQDRNCSHPPRHPNAIRSEAIFLIEILDGL